MFRALAELRFATLDRPLVAHCQSQQRSGCGPSPLRAGLALNATKLSFGQATTSQTKVSCMRSGGRRPRAWLYVEASCWQLLRGRRPYFDNRFEVAARP